MSRLHLITFLPHMLACAALMCFLLSCAPKDTPEADPTRGDFITDNDPRDLQQCAAQPKLAWCVAACQQRDREWCA